MKRVLRSTMMAVLVMILMVGMMAPAAMAAYEPISADVDVTIKMDSLPADEEIPEEDPINVTITKISEDSPAAPAALTINCKAADRENGTTGTFTLGAFDKPGEHFYGVTIGTSGHKYSVRLADDEVYGDREVYYVIHVTVENEFNADGSLKGLKTTVSARESDQEFTFDPQAPKVAITDVNYYVPPMSIKVAKVWVNGSQASATVNLVKQVEQVNEEDGTVEEVFEVQETIVLNEENEWQHTFTDLDPRETWDITEEKISGFSVSYNVNKDDPFNWIVTVVNTKALYQTGQLNWPVPVMAGLGSMMVLAGLFLMRKKEDQVNG
ncbi:MAG: LPXTG cell wall anchor domain-containing protein [Oscillospiraceae bacterium]|nr:LPXTG cell wall anchor domain-containing protein [Oscillospiraceae bacterium]MBQ7130377.1 LPXTG cell wall anchor domain-containing protein [Oscillospiraceae bacterium]